MELIQVSLIRQFCFCPRIFYFYSFCDFVPTYPAHVKFGNEFHARQDKLQRSRSFKKLGLENFIAKANFYMQDDELCGVCDLLFVGDDEVVVLEFKDSKSLSLSRGAKFQLLAYARLASTYFNLPCKRMILCSGTNLKHKEFAIKNSDFKELDNIIAKMKSILNGQIFPNSSASLNACEQCEFYNHCDDRF